MDRLRALTVLVGETLVPRDGVLELRFTIDKNTVYETSLYLCICMCHYEPHSILLHTNTTENLPVSFVKLSN